MLFGEKLVRLWKCLEVIVEGEAAVTGDEKVPGLGDRVNDSTEIGRLDKTVAGETHQLHSVRPESISPARISYSLWHPFQLQSRHPSGCS